VTSFVHLGHTINTELTDKDDILHKRCTFIGQVNNELCYFPRLDADVRYKFFKSNCSSIFGCELWHLNDININQFCTTWRTGLRRPCEKFHQVDMKNYINYSKTTKTTYCLSTFRLHAGSLHQDWLPVPVVSMRRVWKIPNTAHSDLVHMMSDEWWITDFWWDMSAITTVYS